MVKEQKTSRRVTSTVNDYMANKDGPTNSWIANPFSSQDIVVNGEVVEQGTTINNPTLEKISTKLAHNLIDPIEHTLALALESYNLTNSYIRTQQAVRTIGGSKFKKRKHTKKRRTKNASKKKTTKRKHTKKMR